MDSNLPVVNTLKTANSSVRLIAIMGPNKMTAVIGSLNFNLTPNITAASTGQCAPGLIIGNFQPTPVAIPEKALDGSGLAHIALTVGQPAAGGGGLTYTYFYSDTVFPDNPANPTDYYITPATTQFGEVNYNITALPRSTTPPSVPSNIKIRVVNMSNLTDTFQRTGPLTLTYADGSPVSAETTNLPAGVASHYIEIPYNTYRFRLFNQAGVEVPESVPYNGGTIATTWPTTTFHGYQPGGVYTLYINSNAVFEIGSCSAASMVSGNCYSVIPDITPPVNTSFALVQFVNTIPSSTFSLALDNTTIGQSIPFRAVSGYQAMSLGTYSMTLTDGAGHTAVQQNISINPDDNLTVWSYMKNGVPALAITASNVSAPNTMSARFMNFSLDVPYITFTYNGQVLQVINPSSGVSFYPDINDTTSAADASENLAIGVPATHLPYTPIMSNNLPMQVNKSDAGPPPFVPGVPMINVRQLLGADFTINNSLYPAGDPVLTNGETGVYTVALTGLVDVTSNLSAVPDTLLIVKHFK